MENLALFVAAGAVVAVGAIATLVKPSPAALAAASAAAAAAESAAAPPPTAAAATGDAPRARSAASDAIAGIAERAAAARRAAAGADGGGGGGGAGEADTDEDDSIDLDEWRGRRQAARLSCDACVVLALLAAMAWVLSHDYGVDVSAALRSALPREAALLEDVARGARGALGAPAAWWREWSRGEEL